MLMVRCPEWLKLLQLVFVICLLRDQTWDRQVVSRTKIYSYLPFHSADERHFHCFFSSFKVLRAFDGMATSDLTNGMRLGESEIFNMDRESEEIRLFRKMAFGSQNFSTSFFNQDSWSGEANQENSRTDWHIQRVSPTNCTYSHKLKGQLKLQEVSLRFVPTPFSILNWFSKMS